MAIIYLYLGLLALTFSLFGFLVHAFYFVPQRERRLHQDVEDLRRSLEQKRTSVKEALEEAARSSEIIRALEQQVQQRNSDMETLKGLVSRQDEEIKMLQKDAEIIRMAVAGAGKAAKPASEGGSATMSLVSESATGRVRAVPLSPVEMEPKLQSSATLHQFEPREQNQGAPGSEQAPEETPKEGVPEVDKSGAAPGWKENLESILSILDAMEKEVQK